MTDAVNNRSLIVLDNTVLPTRSGRYGDELPDLEILLADRPGASKKDLRKQAERQIRLALEAKISRELGIPEGVLRKLSLDQIKDAFRRAMQALEEVQKFAEKVARDSVRGRRLHKPENRRIVHTDTSEADSLDIDKPARNKKNRPRKARNIQDRRTAKDQIRDYETEEVNIRRLFGGCSNNFVRLGTKDYSPYDIYGHYIGAEIRALESNTQEKQLGDNDNVHGKDLEAKKKEELATSFVASTPQSFFIPIRQINFVN